MIDLPEEQKMLDEFKLAWREYEASFRELLERLEVGELAAVQGAFNTTSLPAFERSSEILHQLIAFAKQQSAAAAAHAEEVYRRAILMIVVVILLAIALAGAAIAWTSRHISLPIMRVSEAMRRLTSGDYSVSVEDHRERKDEVGVLIEAVSGYRESLMRSSHMARHDALTDLPNRILFKERIEEALAARARAARRWRCSASTSTASRASTTRFGHPVGDALLQAGRRAAARTRRDADTVARLGGDEFAIVQVGVEQPQDATALAQRHHRGAERALRHRRPSVIIGASVGIALAPADGDDPDAAAARTPTWRSTAPRTKAAAFTASSSPRWTRACRRAARSSSTCAKRSANGEFELYYQPMLNLATE